MYNILIIKAKIKKQEQKLDGTYNVKLRFTLDRKMRRLATSLFHPPPEIFLCHILKFYPYILFTLYRVGYHCTTKD
ncbi:hypothetical protein DXD57_14015 [Bacteroides intestinalis]|nr:hypothetical protein DXD57_14015 [Bacteroides intestinalis]